MIGVRTTNSTKIEDPILGKTMNLQRRQTTDNGETDSRGVTLMRHPSTVVEAGADGGRYQSNTLQSSSGLAASLQKSSPADSATTQMLTESSTLSLQEMFDEDDFLNHDSDPADNVHNEHLYHSNLMGMGSTVDPWVNGGHSSMDKDDQPSFMAPLSLYSGTKYAVPTVMPDSSYPSSLASSGMNTSASQATGINSNTDLQSCSASSNTTSSVSRSNRPILYSAIGSLENFNASSFVDLSRRVGPRRDFSTLGTLDVPPSSRLTATTTGESTTADSVSGTQVTRSSHGLSSQDPHVKSSVRSTASSKATPTASNRKLNDEITKEDASNLPSTDETDKTKTSNPSSLKKSKGKVVGENGKSKKVTMKKEAPPKKPIEMFRPSCDAYTPRIAKKTIEYRKAEMRTPVQKMASPMGTLSRPNFRDALRRVAMIIHKHIVKIEGRFERDERDGDDHGLFKKSMRDLFSEDNYCTPTYRCTMVRIPMARPGMVYGLRKIKNKQTIPSEEEIYEFAHQLFKAVQLSSECSIVCLIYVERLMEAAKVPLLANTWRPIFMCGLLLASKVWQDLSSWNIEFAGVYPQYSLEAVNRLELNFLRNVKWDLYISTSLYAKYYFALRSLVEKSDFRQRYNRMVGGVDNVAQSEAMKISKRTEQFKEETISQLSRSM